MSPPSGDELREAIALVAPGTPLRAGIDRILQAQAGALVVLGDNVEVLSICTGGFLFDTEFTPQRLSELAKMDGAIVLTSDASRIARANVHLGPKSSIPTSETGTRHRTAERVARSIDVPVVAVSEETAMATVYRHHRQHTLGGTARLLDLASQAVSTALRYKFRFDAALASLFELELDEMVTARDVAMVLQPGELIRRIEKEIQNYLVELGEDGRLIELQIYEFRAGIEEVLGLVPV